MIRAGGWDPRYARVLVVGGCERAAVALVDVNDDGSVEQCVLRRDTDGHWRESVSSGFVSTSYGWGGQQEGFGHVIAYGRVEVPGPVTTVVRGVELRADATDEGWWAAVAPLPEQ